MGFLVGCQVAPMIRNCSDRSRSKAEVKNVPEVKSIPSIIAEQQDSAG